MTANPSAVRPRPCLPLLFLSGGGAALNAKRRKQGAAQRQRPYTAERVRGPHLS